MKDNAPCIACNSSRNETDELAAAHLSLSGNLRIMRCADCGLRWLYPMKSMAEYDAMYKSSYFENIPGNYEIIAAQRQEHFRRRIRSIKSTMRSRSTISLLDVGAATGEFVAEARKTGINAAGIEPSNSACERAQNKYGIDLLRGEFLDFDFGSQQFDVVHMNHVFEHFPDPVACIQKVGAILKEEGLLVLEVPNQFDNIHFLVLKAIRRLKPQRFSIYSIHHPFFYTPKSIRQFLQNHNFDISEMSTWKPYLITRSGSFYPGATFIEHVALMLGDLVFKGGLFIEIYAHKRRVITQ